MRGLREGLTIALSLVLVMLLGACSSSGSASMRASCNGEVCVQVMGQRSSVADVIGYFQPGSDLTGRTWQLMLSAYPCNPNAKGPSCRAAAVYPGPVRRGNPPVEVSCPSGAQTALNGAAPTRCPTRLAEQLASDGDWRRFYDPSTGLPHRYLANTWLCVSVQFTAPPSRSTYACSEVVA